MLNVDLSKGIFTDGLLLIYTLDIIHNFQSHYL